MFSRNIKLYKGVTLLELLIVMASIIIMTGIGFSIWQSSRGDMHLLNAQREVASAIKMAQSYALQGKTQDTGSGPFVPCGYGFYIINDAAMNKYKIIYKKCSDGSYADLSPSQIFQLKNGVTFGDHLDHKIIFKVPFGDVILNEITPSLTLCYGSCSSSSKTITISDGAVIEN